MAGSGQELIKLALAEDMNCGITPWIASNPISLAQWSWGAEMSFSLQGNTLLELSWENQYTELWRFLLKFLLDFYTRLNLPTALSAWIFPFEFLSLNNSVISKWAKCKKQSKPPQLEFNIIRRSVVAWYKQQGKKKAFGSFGRKIITNHYWKDSYPDNSPSHSFLCFV